MNKQKGFSLIEILTGMSVFVLVVGLLSGLFFSSLNLQRRTFINRDLQDNGGYILDLMSKEIRTGTDFSMPSSELRFTNDRGEVIRYRRNSSLTPPAIQRSQNDGSSYDTLTSTTINVGRLDFILGSGQQPRITIVMKMSSNTNPQLPPLEAQTTLSARQLE